MFLFSNLDLQIISWFKFNLLSVINNPFSFFKLTFIAYILTIFYTNEKYNVKGAKK